MDYLSVLNNKKNWPMLLLVSGVAFLVYISGLFDLWIFSEEYGHGMMVVGLLVYIIYRRQSSLVFSKLNQPWLVYLLFFVSLFLIVFGQASGIGIMAMYGIWLMIAAIILYWGGFALLSQLVVPLLIILLLIPLPNPFGPMLTSKLQLISSQLGVWFIRLFGGTVYLEGNVLDMAGAKLLVAEACAGLRYLFPLMSIGAIGGFLLQGPLWMRWAIFLVTIPITVVLNSFRIGMTGILTENWGTSHTEGLLHFFEGWVVFVFAIILLAIFSWLLIKLHNKHLSLADAFSIDLAPDTTKADSNQIGLHGLTASKGVWGLVAILALSSVITPILGSRSEIIPQHESLGNFPNKLANWTSTSYRLPSATEAVAGASEYYYADFKKENSTDVVNVYIAFYETQKKGNIPHSPKVCIPGDGWNIDSADEVNIQSLSGRMIRVNRLVISKENIKTISYYWLKQGNHTYTNELKARLSLLETSLLNNRTDGALVRLVTQLNPGEDIKMADARIAELATPFLDALTKFVPD